MYKTLVHCGIIITYFDNVCPVLSTASTQLSSIPFVLCAEVLACAELVEAFGYEALVLTACDVFGGILGIAGTCRDIASG